jgi:DNA primase catalytic core
MPRIPDSELERIKATVDLAAIVRSRGIELKKHGSRDLIGRCPFHEEASASFVVTPAKRIFHCLGCGAAGNVIQFVERFDGVSFRHAFELLAAGSGFAVPDERAKWSTVPRLDAPLDFAADDAALMHQIVDYYHERLINAATGAPARDYLAKRGLNDEATLKRLKIGFADRSLGLRLPHKNRKDGAEIRERLTKLGIYRESGHEHLNGCVIVPITDAQGNITELYGRRLDDGGRSGIKHLYLPGPHVGIFNLAALDELEVILCEALLDALTFLAAGFANVTSIYGTEGFTDELFNELKRKKVQRVKLAYDADEAGERAATRDAERLRAVGIEVYRIKFPWGMDANEYARKVTLAAQPRRLAGAEIDCDEGAARSAAEGEPAVRRLVSQSLRLLINGAAWLGGSAAKADASKNGTASHVAPALPSSLVAASLAATAHDEAAKEEKLVSDAATVGETMPIPAAMGAARSDGAPRLVECGDFHTFTLDGREYRLFGFAKNNGLECLKLTLRLRVGERLHSDQIDLCKDGDRRRFIERAAEECQLTPEAVKRDLGRLLLACEQWQEAKLRALAEPTTPQAAELSPEQREAALGLLRAPDLLTQLDAAMELCGLVGERSNGRAAYLAAVSRKLSKPLAVIVQSTSAAGKSTLMDAVLNFFPEEERIKYSAMTGQSLYYLGDANLKHKILAIVEEEGAEKASYALKLLQSEGELTIASTGKDPNTGRMETQEYHVEGPVMIFLTTTTIDIDDELLNRCLVLSVDESTAQTARIHERQRQARTLEGVLEREARKDVLALWRDAQRLIRSLGVVNPFAGALTFTAERTRTRRDHEKYLTLIDSIALLHQHQRKITTREVNGRSVEFIEVTVSDIETANALAPELLGRSLDELPPQTRRLLNHLRELVRTKIEETKQQQSRIHFSRREVCAACGWTYAQVRTHLERLIEVELVASRAGRNGAAMLYELLMDANAAEEAWQIGLIDVAKLKAAHNYDPNLDGKRPHLDPPCESPPSSPEAL